MKKKIYESICVFCTEFTQIVFFVLVCVRLSFFAFPFLLNLSRAHFRFAFFSFLLLPCVCFLAQLELSSSVTRAILHGVVSLPRLKWDKQIYMFASHCYSWVTYVHTNSTLALWLTSFFSPRALNTETVFGLTHVYFRVCFLFVFSFLFLPQPTTFQFAMFLSLAASAAWWVAVVDFHHLLSGFSCVTHTNNKCDGLLHDHYPDDFECLRTRTALAPLLKL